MKRNCFFNLPLAFSFIGLSTTHLQFSYNNMIEALSIIVNFHSYYVSLSLMNLYGDESQSLDSKYDIQSYQALLEKILYSHLFLIQYELVQLHLQFFCYLPHDNE